MDLLCTWIRIFVTRLYLFGVHSHPVPDGQCIGSLETTTRLIAHKVAKTPPAIFLHDPIPLKFNMFLLVPTLPKLKSLSLKKLSSTCNPICPFSLDDFSHCLGYFNMFREFILHQHMPEEFFFSEWQTILSKFTAPKITAIIRRMKRM